MRSVNRSCWILAFTLVTYSPIASAQELASDFWDKSLQLKQDLYEKRRIIVSVTNTETRTEFKGVGLVQAKFDKIWAFATNPEKIKGFAKGLDQFDWNPQTGDCYASFKVLWKAFTIKAKTDLRPKSEPPQIGFEFLDGSWVKLNGQLELKRHQSEQTLVILRAHTPEGQFAGWHFAMEAVLQRIAGSLREAVEKD